MFLLKKAQGMVNEETGAWGMRPRGRVLIIETVKCQSICLAQIRFKHSVFEKFK